MAKKKAIIFPHANKKDIALALPLNIRSESLHPFLECFRQDDLRKLIVKHLVDQVGHERWKLLSLRLVCRRLKNAMSTPTVMSALFTIVYAFPKNRSPGLRQSESGLSLVGRHCRELVVKLCHSAGEDPESLLEKWLDGRYVYAPGAIFHDGSMDDRTRGLQENAFPCDYAENSDWPRLLEYLPDIEVLTIITSRHPGGVCLTPISSSLISLRIALERSSLSKLRDLHFLPIHAAYIPHFQWSGASLGEARSWAARSFSNITILEMQILSPLMKSNLPLPYTQHAQLTKTIHAFLKSFSPRLRILRWAWASSTLDEGPHPLGFDTEIRPDKQTNYRPFCPAIPFPELREMWVGRVKDEALKRQFVLECCPKLKKYFVLTYGSGFLQWKEDGLKERWEDPLYLEDRAPSPEPVVNDSEEGYRESAETARTEGTDDSLTKIGSGSLTKCATSDSTKAKSGTSLFQRMHTLGKKASTWSVGSGRSTPLKRH